MRDTGKSTKEEREQTTLQSLLWKRGLPQPIRDFVEKFIAGEPLPYSDMPEADLYGETELIVAALSDHYVSNDPLPEGARDFVQEYLYRLEESSDIHIWSDPDVARTAYPLMFRTTNGQPGYMLEGECLDASLVKAALSHLCTRRELAAFYERHGISDTYKGRKDLAGSVPIDEGNYHNAAQKLARYLADPRTPPEVRRDLSAGLVKLASVTGTHVDHPALCGRAMEVMCEGIHDDDAQTLAVAEHLINLIDSLPPLSEGKGGDE